METKNIVLWVVIGILAVAVVYASFMKGGGGNVAGAAQAAQSYGGMVGGC